MPEYLSDSQAKETILEIGRRMYAKNFVAANDGNISCRVGEDSIWATPTRVSKGFMDQETLINLRLDGTVVSKGSLNLSSEIKMHLRIYNENPQVRGVAHAHPPACTSFAVAGLGLDQAIYPEALVNLSVVPCVHYETPGSQGVADSVAPYCNSHSAVLLANHGALSWGKSPMEAFFRLESMEHYAMILLYTGGLIGQAKALSYDQVRELINIRQKLGISGGCIPVCAEQPANLQDSFAGYGTIEEARNKNAAPCCRKLTDLDVERIADAVVKKLQK